MATMRLFDAAVNDLLRIEGGYSNHPEDRGGKTRYGITEAVARGHGYTGSMKDLPLDLAIRIYEKDYWDRCRCDDICALDLPLGLRVFDMAVNMGPGGAGKVLQQELTLLNRRGKDYPDLKVDGEIGPVTVAALSALLKKRGEAGHTVINRAVRNMQGSRYHYIAKDNESQEDFYFGWLLHRNA